MFVRAAGVQGTESGGVPGQFKCLSQLLEFKRVLELEQYQDRVSIGFTTQINYPGSPPPHPALSYTDIFP